MPRLADRQGNFARALLDATLPAPSGLVGPDREPSAKRFAVYRNNVVVRLVHALEDAFPAVQRIVGSDFFLAMARAYVVSEPPRSPILLGYGAGFPSFIQAFRPAEALPYLKDVARIEWAWTEAYHAAEATRLDRSAFLDVETDRRPYLSLVVHPSLRIVRSPLPALTIWRMNVGDGVPGPVDLASGGEDAMIVRPAAEVEVRLMPPGGAVFVQALVGGASVADAASAALTADDRFNLAANLAELIDAGAFVGYRP